MAWRLLAVVTVLVPSIVLFPSPSHACSCGSAIPTLSERFERSDAVFRGILVARATEEIDYQTELQFETVTVWKGRVPPTVSIRMHTGTSCALYVRLDIGEEYVVYADDGEIGGFCGHTAIGKAVENQEIVEMLGPGRPAEEGAVYPNAGSGGLVGRQQTKDIPLVVLAVSGVFLAIATTAYWLVGRHRTQSSG